MMLVDGGGSFFKVGSTILPENYDWDTDISIYIEELAADMERMESSGLKKEIHLF